ncbi:hypothetical protein J6590_026323 [Homalodisca vitripennis]|nr:hypothetical protein J6590_026323 [Homalodisca vitripennis]
MTGDRLCMATDSATVTLDGCQAEISYTISLSTSQGHICCSRGLSNDTLSVKVLLALLFWTSVATSTMVEIVPSTALESVKLCNPPGLMAEIVPLTRFESVKFIILQDQYGRDFAFNSA